MAFGKRAVGPFDVVAASQQLLSRNPDIISIRLDVPHLVSWWLGCFSVIDGLTYLGLRVALPKDTVWEAKVKIREALVSCVHDLITVQLVYKLLRAISHAEDGPGGLLGIGPLAHIPMALIDQAGCLFIGFLLWDSFHYLIHRM